MIAGKLACSSEAFSLRYLLFTPICVDDGDDMIEFCGMWLTIGFCSDSETDNFIVISIVITNCHL